MTWVYTENVTCPVCGADTAHTDLEIHTNQRDFDCVRCGYSYQSAIVERGGKQFWQVTQQLPMSADGKVAWPDIPAIKGGQWSRKEFGVMPGYETIPDGFGVEEAE